MSDASLRAARRMRARGFQLPGEPDYKIPELPPDITEEHEKNLMVLFSEIVSWLDWVEFQLVQAQIDERSEENELEKIGALEQVKYKGEKTVTAAKAHIFESQEYLDQRQHAFVAYSDRKMLEVMFNSLDRKKFVISREITRRQNGH